MRSQVPSQDVSEEACQYIILELIAAAAAAPMQQQRLFARTAEGAGCGGFHVELSSFKVLKQLLACGSAQLGIPDLRALQG